MPAIASLEELKSAQKELLEAKDLDELKAIFKKWRRIGWRNVCKLWLEERTPKQLKGGGGGRERRQLNCFWTRNHPGKGKKASERIELRPSGRSLGLADTVTDTIIMVSLFPGLWRRTSI